ncbi:MAG: TatD family hydrolase [Planctomycetes bacterium]|nr:TatD family hydrolase [Planctomycetota bacterium]
MRIIDPHVHMYSRTTDDYQRMAAHGINCLIEPGFWLGSDREYAESFWDYFNHLTTFEPGRAKKYGITHYSFIAVNPKEARNKVAKDAVKGMYKYLERDNVLGIGEIGFDLITDAEEEIMKMQMDYAEKHKLLILIHTPHVKKPQGTERTIKVIEKMGLTTERILIDHNTEETIDMSLACGKVFCGHTLYPVSKMSPGRMVALIKKHGTDRILMNSAADWGVSDPLAVVKAVDLMWQEGFSEAEISKVVWDNPHKFFGQSSHWKLEK